MARKVQKSEGDEIEDTGVISDEEEGVVAKAEPEED